MGDFYKKLLSLMLIFLGTSFTMVAQDLSLALTLVGDSQLCSDSNIPSFDIKFTATDFAVDLREEKIFLNINGATNLVNFELTVPNDPKFNLATNTFATLRIDDETIEDYPTALNQGISSISVSLTVAGDVNVSNNSSSKSVNYILPNTPSILSEPAGFNYCINEPVQFTASGGNESDTYYWRFGDDVLVSGKTISKPAGSLVNGETVKLYLVTSEGCSSTLTTQVITVDDLPQITLNTTPADKTICKGDSFDITIIHDNYAGGNTTYKINGGDINYQNILALGSHTYNISNIQAETQFTVEVQNNNGCSTTENFTILVPLVDDVGEIATNFNSTLCYADRVDQTIYGDGTNGSTAASLDLSTSVGSSISYVWQWKKPNSDNTWSTFPGSGNTENLDSSILETQPLTEDIRIRRLVYAVKGSDTCLVDLAFNELTFNVSSVNTPAITQINDDYSLCASEDSITLQVNNGTLGDEYHWYKNSSFQSSSTSTFFTISSNDISENAEYGVKIVNSSGCESQIVTKTISISDPIEIVLTTNKAGNTVCQGDAFTLTVSLTNQLNGDYTYTYDTGGISSSDTNSDGIKTFTFNQGVEGETTFTVTVENDQGCSAFENITVKVPRIGNGGSISTNHSGILCSGDGIDQPIIGDGTLAGSSSATLSIDSSDSTIVYLWQLKGDSDSDWRIVAGSSNTINLSSDILNALDILERTRFRRLAYAKIGSVQCLQTEISYPEVIFEVSNPRSLNLTTSDNTICVGQNTTYNASGLLNGDSFEWRINGVTKASGIASGSSLSYTVNSSDASIGNNTIEIFVSPQSIVCSSTTSASFTLSESPIVSLDSDKDFDSVCVGEDINVTASILQLDTGKFSFRVNEIDYPKQSSNILVLKSADLTSPENNIEVFFTSDTTSCTSNIASITIQKITPSGGEIGTAQSSYCVNDIPVAITTVSAGGSNNINTSNYYYWETSPDLNFSTDVSKINSNTLTLNPVGPISRTTFYRRVFVANIGGVGSPPVGGKECLEYSNTIELRVFSSDGGSIDFDLNTPGFQDELYECDLVLPTIDISVIDTNAQGNYTYQWQFSTNQVNWTNVTASSSSQSPTYTLTATQTTGYYRRLITDNSGICGTSISTILTYVANALDPGSLDASLSGAYCYGADPPLLGLNSSVAIPSGQTGIIYQWQRAERNDLLFSDNDFSPVPDGGNGQTYNPPTLNSLFRNVAYRRAVRIDDGSSNPCWRYTDTIIFTQFHDYDWGEVISIDPTGQRNDFLPFCEGESFPGLQLNITDPNAIRFLNDKDNGVSFQWQRSYDLLTWTNVRDNRDFDDFFRIEGNLDDDQNDPYYLSSTREMYFRVYISFNNGDPTSANFVNDQHETGQQIRLVNRDPNEVLDTGEVYVIRIGTSVVSLTVDISNNTTDQIGSLIAQSITNQSNGYSAIYYSDSNIVDLNTSGVQKDIQVFTYDDQSGQVKFNNSLDFVVTNQVFSINTCNFYTPIFHLDVEKQPSIDFGESNSQMECRGGVFDPLLVTWTGTGSLTISGLDPNLSVSSLGAGGVSSTVNGDIIVFGTNSLTITGPANFSIPNLEQNQVSFRLNATCGNSTGLMTTPNQVYTFNVFGSAPSINGLFRDELYENGGRYRQVQNSFAATNQNVNFNDVVVLDPNEFDNQTIDLYACFDENANGFKNLEWIISLSTLELNYNTNLSPASVLKTLYDTDGENIEEEGVQLLLNRSFFDDNPTVEGALVDIGVRSAQICDEAKSSIATFTLYFLNAPNHSTSDLPTLMSPEPINVDFCGFDTNPVPTCEILDGFFSDNSSVSSNTAWPTGDIIETEGKKYYTQFFSGSINGLNSFASLSWQIKANDEAWGVSGAAGSISSDGYVLWNEGFSGTVQIRVAPVTANSTTSSSTVDETKWSYSSTYIIGEVDETIPEILVSTPLVCPPPNPNNFIKEKKSFAIDLNYFSVAIPPSTIIYNTSNLGADEGITISYNGSTLTVKEGENGNFSPQDLVNEINGNNFFGSAITLSSSRDAFHQLKVDISLTESSTTQTETVKAPGTLRWDFGAANGVVNLVTGDDENIIAQKLSSAIDLMSLGGITYRASSQGSVVTITESINGMVNVGTSSTTIPSFTVSSTHPDTTANFELGTTSRFEDYSHYEQGILITVTNNSNSVSLEQANLSINSINWGTSIFSLPIELVNNLNQFNLASIDTEFAPSSYPNEGIVTSTFYAKNGQDVDWYILRNNSNENLIIDNIGLAASVVQYDNTNYFLVDGNSGNLNKDLTITWAPNAGFPPLPGSFQIKAVPKNCSGTRPEWVRDLNYNIPNHPSLNYIVDTNVNPTQIDICEGVVDFPTIRYEIRTREYDNIRITEPIDPNSTLVNKFITEIEHQTQSVTVRIDNNSGDEFTRKYIIRINNTDFALDIPPNQSPETTAQQFTALIQDDPDFSPTLLDSNYPGFQGADGKKIVIETVSGVYIENFNVHATGKTTIALTSALQQKYPILKIKGLSSPLEPGNYSFLVDLNLGDDSYCTQAGAQPININVYDDVNLIHDQTQGAKDQVICNNGDIDTIVWDAYGKDPTENLNFILQGLVPKNISIQQVDWNVQSPTFSIIPSGQKTNYWNTRNFNFQVVSENDNCTTIQENVNLRIYPEDFIRTSTVTPSISQQLCEGVSIEPIYYEFWGSDNISATIEDSNDLNLNYSISNRAQVASITFNNLWPTNNATTNRNEVYRIYLNDIVYEHHINQNTPPTAGTNISPITILGAFVNLINNDNSSPSTVSLSQSDSDGDGNSDYAELIFTGKVPGITFSIDTRTINATYVFDDPKMITAPKLITITGTPTVEISNLTDVQSYTFNIVTLGSNYCDDSKPSGTSTYTLIIESQPSVEVTSDYPDLTVCDGFTVDSIDFTVYRGSGFQISTTSTNSLVPSYPGFGSTVTPVFVNQSFYQWTPNVFTGVETITTFTYTVTPTGNQCGDNITNTITGTLTVIPHYLNHIQFSGSEEQTLCEAEEIIPINYKWSGDYSSVNILWENGLNPGLNLSSTSNTLSLSGTIEVPDSISTTTSYSYRIEVDGDHYQGVNCNTLVASGTINVIPKSEISLMTSASSLNQTICDGNSIELTKFNYSLGASNYEIQWFPNKPNGLILSPLPESTSPGTTTITMSGIINSGVTTRTVYNYTINTLNNVNGCSEDSISGSITIYPSEDKFFISSSGDSSYCFGEFINLEYEFQGIPNLLLTDSSIIPEGLTVTSTYTTKTKAEYTVSGSTGSQNESYQFKIINYSGLSSNTYTYNSSSVLSDSQLASQIATSIINENILVTADNNKIIFQAKESNFSFIVTNSSSGTAQINLTNYTQNRGKLSITGTPTTDIFEVTNYEYGIKTPGLYCESFVVTNTIYLNPKSYIELSTAISTQFMDVCDGTEVELIKYHLSGAASNYSIEWSNGMPSGLIISPVPGGASSSNSTITLSGVINTGVTSRTIYPYTINTLSSDGSCKEDKISGSIIVYPSEDKYILSNAGDASYCFGEPINMIYEFRGVSGLTLTSGSNVPNGLNFVTTYTQSPSIKLSITGNTSKNDIYSFTIIENNLGERNYNYLPKSIKIPSQIASDISSLISDTQIRVTVVEGISCFFLLKMTHMHLIFL